MRAIPTSDFHLEKRGLNEIPVLTDSFDVLVCAGDIWEGQPEKSVQSVVDLARGKPAIIVPGNHDFWTKGPDQRTISDFIRLMRDEADRQNSQAHRDIVTVLSADAPVCEIEQTRFIGLTLWTDWAQAGRWMVDPTDEIAWAARAREAVGKMGSGPREFGAIRTERGPWTPYDAVAEHARQKAILLDEMERHHDGPTVVITHHPPLGDCADVYRHHELPWWTPAFYGSEILPRLPKYIRPHTWIFGHIHAAFDVQCGNTRAVCNPVEGGQFNPNLVLEI
jgi:Icc-related predicted phosphoesterase